MENIFAEYWIYIIPILVIIILILIGWIIYRKWIMNNLFGIYILSSIPFSFEKVRFYLKELVGFDLENSSPPWQVLCLFGVLHLLSVNKEEILAALKKSNNTNLDEKKEPVESLQNELHGEILTELEKIKLLKDDSRERALNEIIEKYNLSPIPGNIEEWSIENLKERISKEIALPNTLDSKVGNLFFIFRIILVLLAESFLVHGQSIIFTLLFASVFVGLIYLIDWANINRKEYSFKPIKILGINIWIKNNLD